jgi:surface antigen
MKSVPARVAALAVAVALCGPAAAFNDRFMRQGATANMTRDDLTLAIKAINEALDDPTDGAVHTWTNTKTGALGTVTPTAPFKSGGRTCRRVETFTTARGRDDRATWSFCKTAKGWQLGS